MSQYSNESNELLKHFQKASQITPVSTSTVGATPMNSISDHLPVVASDSSGKPLVVSYNMLSDQHLYNNFMNVANFSAIQKDLQSSPALKDNKYTKELNMFFYEMAEFSKQRSDPKSQYFDPEAPKFDSTAKNITYSDKDLDAFLKSDYFFRTRDPSKSKVDRQAIGQWIKDLPEKSGKDGGISKQDVATTIAHSLQTLHHIEYGGLKHDESISGSRLNLLLDSKTLDTFHDSLKEGAFVNLQECTNPELIVAKLNAKGGNFKAIVHNTAKDGLSKDNCVIIYNADKFNDPQHVEKFGLAEKKDKPAIVAAFERKDGGKPIVVGSVHHPGGKHDEMTQINDKVNAIQSKVPDADVIVSGDFNHSKEFFKEPEGLTISDTKSSTMSGPDFARSVQNKSIDLVVSNLKDIQVNVADIGQKKVQSITADVPISVTIGKASATLANREHFAQRYSNELTNGVSDIMSNTGANKLVNKVVDCGSVFSTKPIPTEKQAQRI